MSDPLWTSDAAAEATTGRVSAPFEVTGVTADSRALAPGDLFVALTDARDGHDFVAAAFDAGAGAALVSRRPDGVADDAPLLIVPDVQKAVEDLAVAARARAQAKVIGVTGSVGKTGAKEMLRAGLTPSGETHAAEKSFNNHWGVPLTLARMPARTRFAAIEIGMNHPGEIAPLSRLARPDVAIITTIAPVHMAAFSSEEEIADAKAEIFEGLAPGGVAVLNRDNRHYGRLAEAAAARGAKILSFGAADDADARLDGARVTSTATVVKATLHGRPLVFKLGA
ncbi:MAG: Mur ligase family protein, partial [Pseudomonadota bacterium]